MYQAPAKSNGFQVFWPEINNFLAATPILAWQKPMVPTRNPAKHPRVPKTYPT